MVLHRGKRNAAVAPLVAILLIPLMGMVAFAVDMGYVVLVKADLQDVADAAALAGVQELRHNYPLHVTATTATQRNAQIELGKTRARLAVQNYGSYNKAGGVSISIPTADISFGYTAADGTFDPASTNYPNTVRVQTRREAGVNGRLALFFAPAIGIRDVDVRADAQAVAYVNTPTGFRSLSGYYGRILPMTYDQVHWHSFLSNGLNPDGVASVAGDGSPQVSVYPSIKFNGNFGELAADDMHNGSSDIINFIDHGVPQSAIDSLTASHLIPLPSHANAWDWRGNNGLKASTIMAVNDHVGQEYILPLYKAYNAGTAPRYTDYAAGVGGGSHYDFNIVEFVQIRIMPVSRPNSEIIVQPTGRVDPILTFEASRAGIMGETYATDGSPITTFYVARLSDH